MSDFWKKIIKMSEHWGPLPLTPISLRRQEALLPDPRVFTLIINTRKVSQRAILMLVRLFSLESKYDNRIE